MERHFHEELEELKSRLIHMAMAVEDMIANAVEALVKRNTDLAEKVIEDDDRINRFEIEIDDRALKLLALQQPMAVDLRFVTSAMKINNDLERMGDHAVNIAKEAMLINQSPPLRPFTIIPQMAKTVQTMVKESISSFVDEKSANAREVCKRDDEVDSCDDQVFQDVLGYILKDAGNTELAIQHILISKNLERIADLSTNIAEEVIFIYKAKNIKHHISEIEIEDFR